MHTLFLHAHIICQPCLPKKTVTRLPQHQENTLIKTLPSAQKNASSDMKPFLALDNAIINKFKSLSDDLPKKETSRSSKKKTIS
jgi:hypothetical protein